MEFKDTLKQLRKKAGMTQKELSEKSGVSYSYLTKLEGGFQVNPTYEVLEALGKALKVPLSAIYDFRGIAEPDKPKTPSVSDDDLLELLRNNKDRATIIGFGDGRHIKTDMTYEDFEELEAMWRALKEKRKQD